MFLLRRLTFALSLLIGAIFSQLPEYAQQYRQRLGGAIDELTMIIAQFDRDGAGQNLTRDEALKRLASNADPLVRQRAEAMTQTIQRAARLTEQQQDFAKAGNFGRIAAMLNNFDPTIARNAYAAFEPGLPLTLEGAVSALVGFFASSGLLRLLSWPLRRRLHPRAMSERGHA